MLSVAIHKDVGEYQPKIIGNERTEVGVLEPGKYRVHVMSVPSNQDGSVSKQR